MSSKERKRWTDFEELVVEYNKKKLVIEQRNSIISSQLDVKCLNAFRLAAVRLWGPQRERERELFTDLMAQCSLNYLDTFNYIMFHVKFSIQEFI